MTIEETHPVLVSLRFTEEAAKQVLKDLRYRKRYGHKHRTDNEPRVLSVAEVEVYGCLLDWERSRSSTELVQNG